MTNYPAMGNALQDEWKRLARQYFPLVEENSIWCSSLPSKKLPDQGFKLHVSATILNCISLIAALGPIVHKHSLVAKCPMTIRNIGHLNSGLLFGYSQIGKIFTIYFQSNSQLLHVFPELISATQAYAGPSVPFDFAVGNSKCLFYRYGSFKSSESKPVDMIADPSGRLEADNRNKQYVPDWVVDPLAEFRANKVKSFDFWTKHLLIYKALSQRGKGGVYAAIDINEAPPRRCVIKEGRKNGETQLDGRDGSDLVLAEYLALRTLEKYNIAPKTVQKFSLNSNNYLVLEHLRGDNLVDWSRSNTSFRCSKVKRRLLCRLTGAIYLAHSKGFFHRDLKPQNIIIGPSLTVKCLDWEGSVRTRYSAKRIPWGGPGFSPPECGRPGFLENAEKVDIFALGRLAYFILTGCMPTQKKHHHIDRVLKELGGSWPCSQSRLASVRPTASLLRQSFL